MPYPTHIEIRMQERPGFAATVRFLASRNRDTKANLNAAYDRDVAYEREGKRQARRFGRRPRRRRVA